MVQSNGGDWLPGCRSKARFLPAPTISGGNGGDTANGGLGTDTCTTDTGDTTTIC
ncbi:hypothetical protein NKG94_30955 [Micromonospora sp. M12]